MMLLLQCFLAFGLLAFIVAALLLEIFKNVFDFVLASFFVLGTCILILLVTL